MTLIQYIILRGDLNWPVGALIAQGCHASVSAIVKSYNSEFTKEYIDNLNSMHKVVLKAENEKCLVKLSESLKEKNIIHHLWIEMPENIPTCLATAPSLKEILAPLVKSFKLFK